MMRALQIAAIRALDMGARLQGVMRTPHVTLRAGLILLRNSHDTSLSQSARGYRHCCLTPEKITAYILSVRPGAKRFRLTPFFPFSGPPETHTGCKSEKSQVGK